MVKKKGNILKSLLEWVVIFTIVVVVGFVVGKGTVNVLEGKSFTDGISYKDIRDEVKVRYTVYSEGKDEDRVEIMISKTEEDVYNFLQEYSFEDGIRAVDAFTFSPYIDMARDEIEELYKSIDYEVLNEEFGKVINEHRNSLGLQDVNYYREYREGSEKIAKELADYGFIAPEGQEPHTRPNGKGTLTVFEELDVNLYNRGLGENLAFHYTYNNPYRLINERYLAEMMFENWMESRGHRDLMETGDFTGYSLAVYPVMNGNTMRADKEPNGSYRNYEYVSKRTGIGFVGTLTLIVNPE